MPLSRLQTRMVQRLVALGVLTHTQASTIDNAKELGDLNTQDFFKALGEKYGIADFKLHLARAYGFGMVAGSGKRLRSEPALFARLPLEFCQTHRLLPGGVLGSILIVLTSDAKAQHEQGDEVRRITGLHPIFVLVPAADIADKVAQGAQPVGQPTDLGAVIDSLRDEFDTPAVAADAIQDENSGPIVEMANKIIEQAYFDRASDIHLSPQETELVVRFRVDGSAREYLRLPRNVGPALVARIKIMCNLDIAERRLPQDGRIVFKQYTKTGLDIDLRVATGPQNHGEGVVMRILDKQKTTLPLPDLGFSDENLARYRECIRQPYGMILHCGPTGSGKSMTLYSALNEINTPDMVIRTAEDPIEYTLPNLDQMQMHRQIGLTFATALRAFLRQDPDVILVGEIRDKETATIAIEAALTGHLLISTLHTNDAPSTVARLTDMGVEPFMISSSLVCVCAQRLLRRLCKHCKQEVVLEGNAARIMERAIGWSGKVFRKSPTGCPSCGGSGYRGRVGIHELMTANEELTSAINRESDTAELKKICMRHGMKTLHQDSMLKVKMGLTSMEEALGTVPVDMELQEGSKAHL